MLLSMFYHIVRVYAIVGNTSTSVLRCSVDQWAWRSSSVIIVFLKIV